MTQTLQSRDDPQRASRGGSRSSAARVLPRGAMLVALSAGLCAAAALTACGGGASIGGSVTGLGNGLTVVLQNNSTDSLSITGTGAASITFDFITDVVAGKTYSATVLTQPRGQTCTIANATGTIATVPKPITNISVTCTTSSSVVGTVTGLRSGTAVVLQSNGVQQLVGNGNFAFPGLLPTGSLYSVTVATQPVGQICVVAVPIGTVVANTPAVVSVSCS